MYIMYYYDSWMCSVSLYPRSQCVDNPHRSRNRPSDQRPLVANSLSACLLLGRIHSWNIVGMPKYTGHAIIWNYVFYFNAANSCSRLRSLARHHFGGQRRKFSNKFGPVEDVGPDDRQKSPLLIEGEKNALIVTTITIVLWLRIFMKRIFASTQYLRGGYFAIINDFRNVWKKVHKVEYATAIAAFIASTSSLNRPTNTHCYCYLYHYSYYDMIFVWWWWAK